MSASSALTVTLSKNRSTGSRRFAIASMAATYFSSATALFALAADQYRDINSADELESQSTVSALKAMLAKQAAMDKQEAGLFAALTTKKAAVHKAAAKKAKKPVRCVYFCIVR